MSPEHRTSALLAGIANGGRTDDVLLDELLQTFTERAFGVLLLAVTLPSFLPLPVGMGAISGPLIVLVGVQVLFGLHQPWMPKFVRRRGISRASFRRFIDRMQPWFKRLERVSRPRLEDLLDRRAADVVTGLMIVLLGLLLSLPVPFTNYPLGLLVLGYAFALIERDGALLLVVWVLGLVTVLASVLLSNEVVDAIGRLF